MKHLNTKKIITFAGLLLIFCLFPSLRSDAFDYRNDQSQPLNNLIAANEAADKQDAASLTKTDAIYGEVIDQETKQPIRGAVLELKNANFGLGYYKTVTDTTGSFHIADFIKHVNYKIEISATGYNTHILTTEIQPGKYTFRLMKEGIVTGKVVDSANKPLRGVEVKLSSTFSRQNNSEGEESNDNSGTGPRIVTTGADGKYQFNKLAAGTYAATFQKTGYITETAQINRINSGQTFNLPMQMFRPAAISGKIMIRDVDVPAANVDISLDGRSAISTVSYQDGGYNLQDVKPGNYKLILSHRGFNGYKSEIIKIKEGDVKKDFNFSLLPKDPTCEVYSDRYTFVIGQQLGFNLKTLRLEKVKLKLYQLPLEIVLKGHTDADKINPDTAGLKLIREWEESIKDFTPYEWREQHVEIPAALPSGGYCIEVKGENKIISRKFFSVTSIGIVVKRSLNYIFAYTVNLATNKPVGGAPVFIFDITRPKQKTPAPEKAPREERPGPQEESSNPDNTGNQNTANFTPPTRLENLPVKIMMQGKTDFNGTLQFPVKSDKVLAIMAVNSDGSYAFCNAGSPDEFSREKEKLFIYTDRPVYRAGDKVYYKIVGKSMDSVSNPIKNRKLFYRIKNTDVDETIAHGSFSTNEWGAHKGELTLAAEARLGTYEINAGPDENNLYGSGRFYVDQYRKPEFKIDINATKEFYTNRDTIEFKVEAKYLFGSPLKGALVKYRFYESKLRDNDAVYWWEEDGEQSRSYNKIKLEGDKYLDENGVALLKLASGDFPYDREVTLEVTIVDKSNVSISERSTVKVGRGEYYIKIKPRQSFFEGNEKKEIEIKTIAHNGKPQSALVDIKVFRYIWKSWQRIYVHDKKAVYAVKVHTDANGTAGIELPRHFDSFGEFDIVAESKDKKDNFITASRILWIYGPSPAGVQSRFKNLELTLSSTELEKPGEVTCLIKSRYTDSYVCLTVEGKDIYEKKVFSMTGNVLPVKLNIRQEYAPNVFITATMQRGRALFTSTAEVSLPNPDVSMNIELAADKEKYLPGEKVTVKIKATNEKGKPVQGDLSLGVVDEAIYLIRRDHTPKMRDFFYSKNSNWVLTNYSFPFTILAGVGKDGKTKIREKFADTAYWNADIKTDKLGLATINFPLPDNLTTWRLTSRGHDLQGRVGEKKSEILATQDLIARIGKPRFFIEGDKTGLIGIINSNTDRGLPAVDTEFKVNNRLIEPAEKVKLSLPAYGVASSFYDITVPEKQKELELFFRAAADAKARDALKLTLPVYIRGANYKLYGAGDMADNRVVSLTPLQDTDDFLYKPEEISINVNPNPISQLLQGSEYLADYPYGCIEQTINGFLPALALRNLLKQKGLAAEMTDSEKLNNKITEGIERILRQQNEDGTWGWWSGDVGNEYVTGYVLYSLQIAKSLGYDIDKARIDKALAAVERLLQVKVVNNDDARIFLFYTYTLWGKWNSAIFNEFTKSNHLNPYCRAYLIMAMANADKLPDLDRAAKTRIGALLKSHTAALKDMQKKDRFGVYWEHTGNQSWSWPGGNTEITAHVLSALLSVNDKSTLPLQTVNSLMKRNRGAAWKSTKETAAVIFAVCKYYSRSGRITAAEGKIHFKLNGKDLTTIEYDAKKTVNAKNYTHIAKFPPNIKAGNYVFEASGKAAGEVNFNVTINGNLYFKENRLLSWAKGEEDYLKSKERVNKSVSKGIDLNRFYYFVTRVRDINNNEYLVPQFIDDKKGLKIGDEILVKVRFKARDNFEFLVLEDFLPAGFEVVNKNVYDNYQPYAHSERWDNRMVFFFTKISKNNVYEIAYTMRAELPGEFLAKPARMECMYEPDIQGWSQAAKFTVHKK